MVVSSPYKPGFGARPAVLVGRDRQWARARAALTAVTNTRSAAPSVLVLTGARGLGKTVALDVIAEDARDRGFLTATVALDRVSSNPQLLGARIAESIAPLASRTGKAWTRIRAWLGELAIEINTGVVSFKPVPPAKAQEQATTQRQALAALLTGAARFAVDHDHAGFVVVIDELQEAPHDDLVVIANAIQDALRTPDTPLAVFAAGLPTTPDLVTAAATFTERFDYRTLDRLDQESAARALIEPANQVGVRWDPSAAVVVLAAAAGSPYLIQRMGDETWLVSQPEAGDLLTAAAAAEAIADVTESLGSGMFRGRWARAAEGERALMGAIAQAAGEDGVALTRFITVLTGRTSQQLSSTRKSLIDKGLIEAAGHGALRFTMPGFDAFVLGQLSLEPLTTSQRGELEAASARRVPAPPAQRQLPSAEGR